MNGLSASEIDRLIFEDLPYGDLTTHALGLEACAGEVSFTARQPMVVCCTEEAKLIFERLGASATVLVPSGTRAAEGTALFQAWGPAASLLAGWKIAQTLVEWSSGIATAVSDLVEAARAVAPRTVVACTRKTVPFSRRLSVKAVLAGGGTMHRLGLSESVLLFPEHRTFTSPDLSLAELLARLAAAEPERAIVAEVTTVADAMAAAAHADVLQLEKFSADDVARVRARIPHRPDGRPIVAAAGGLHAGNVASYVAAGAQVIVTSSPYYAGPRDVQVRFSSE